MQNPVLLRPVRETDLKSLQALVGQISGGMTSLPDHPNYLKERINDSLRAFDHRITRPGGEVYLFVLEDLVTHKLVGTSGLLSRVGGFDPFYTYRIRQHLQEFAPLQVHNTIQLLELVRNHKGPSEICSLFLHPDYRKNGIGKLLAKSRFLFMKAFPQRFDEDIIAELRGYLDESGRSPFWEAVGKNFFWKDYYHADVLSGIGEKEFIEVLMPEHPIYVTLLPAEAQAMIGEVHPQTVPAKKILLKEGFRVTDEVDIFDAGPILKAKRQNLKSWKQSRTAGISIKDELQQSAHRFLVTNNRLDFRATLTNAVVSEQDCLVITREIADVLGVNGSDTVQYLQIN